MCLTAVSLERSRIACPRPLGMFPVSKIHRPFNAVGHRKRDNVERLVGVILARVIQRFAPGKMRLDVAVFSRDSTLPIGSMDGDRFVVG